MSQKRRLHEPLTFGSLALILLAVGGLAFRSHYAFTTGGADAVATVDGVPHRTTRARTETISISFRDATGRLNRATVTQPARLHRPGESVAVRYVLNRPHAVQLAPVGSLMHWVVASWSFSAVFFALAWILFKTPTRATDQRVSQPAA